ncbi:hypothetical protein N7510_002238 [Penicillium lagena]|uniref:uncharacterized protein n=1 Tax=Penicillium lagena TaxID=94218 RepID=UPI002541ABAD|nr:uncharacterized protein N7510_002238 [Penicillium lagena]KAJ5625929.1 hypothetical protein N7510_002238 [Penicillium lagena]
MNLMLISPGCVAVIDCVAAAMGAKRAQKYLETVLFLLRYAADPESVLYGTGIPPTLDREGLPLAPTARLPQFRQKIRSAPRAANVKNKNTEAADEAAVAQSTL